MQRRPVDEELQDCFRIRETVDRIHSEIFFFFHGMCFAVFVRRRGHLLQHHHAGTRL